MVRRHNITWDSYYAPEDIETLLASNGFASDDVLFVKARKL